MMDTQACETPMSDHIFRFWQHLETEHVRILLDLRRDTSSVVYWDSSSFSDAVAKALVADRAKLEQEHEIMRKTLETIAGSAADQLQATQARGALSNIGPAVTNGQSGDAA